MRVPMMPFTTVAPARLDLFYDARALVSPTVGGADPGPECYRRGGRTVRRQRDGRQAGPPTSEDCGAGRDTLDEGRGASRLREGTADRRRPQRGGGGDGSFACRRAQANAIKKISVQRATDVTNMSQRFARRAASACMRRDTSAWRPVIHPLSGLCRLRHRAGANRAVASNRLNGPERECARGS